MDEIIANGVHYRIINFIMFVGILVYFLRKPLKDFWAARSLAIRHNVEKSLRLKEEAEQKYKAVESRFSRIDQEIKTLVQAIEEETVLEKRQIEEEAKLLSQRIHSDGERIAEQEVQRARESLKADVVMKATALAEKLIRDKITTADQKKLADRFVTQAGEKTFNEVRGTL